VFAAARDESRIPDEAFWRGAFDSTGDHSFDEVAYAVGSLTGGLGLVVYAAGAMHAGALESLPAAEWQRLQAVNLRGAWRSVQVSVPLLAEHASVVAIGAQIPAILLPKFGAYATFKVGLEPMFAVLAKEHRAHSFIVVRPGAVDTPFWANVPFRLPAGAQSADSVAAQVLELAAAGRSGTFDAGPTRA
jgi:3-oxoacyl-[acyl-carrier protein] reductase